MPPTEQLDSLLHSQSRHPSPDAALASIGVDLHAVRGAARRTFGDAAVDELARRRVRRPWQPWRRPTRRCTTLLAGALGMSPRLKHALATAADRRHQAITPAALLAAILDTPGARAVPMLEESGLDVAALRVLLTS